jgi:hypothetical protein
MNAVGSYRELSSTGSDSVSSQRSNQHQPDVSSGIVTLEATPVPIIEERDLAVQYCEDRLREIEEREARLAARELRLMLTKSIPSGVGDTDDLMSTIAASTVVTAQVVSATTLSDPVSVASASYTYSIAAPQNPSSSIAVPSSESKEANTRSRSTSISSSTSVDKKVDLVSNQHHHRKTSSGSGIFSRVLTSVLRPSRSRTTSFGTCDSNGVSDHDQSASFRSNASLSSCPCSQPHLYGWTWQWQETPSRMPNHDPASVVGDPKDCWIRYDAATNRILETKFLSQNRKGSCTLPGNVYEVEFVSMQQTKLATGYQRKVKRQFLRPPSDPNAATSANDISIPTTQIAGIAAPPVDVTNPNPHSTACSKSPPNGSRSSSMNHPRTRIGNRIDLGDDSPPVPRTGNTTTPKSNNTKDLISKLISCDSAAINESPVWCWRETPSQMPRHDETVVISREDCWIRYSYESSRILEVAFCLGQRDCQPLPGYTVDFSILSREETPVQLTVNGTDHKTIKLFFVQIKDATGYQRDVMRMNVEANR